MEKCALIFGKFILPPFLFDEFLSHFLLFHKDNSFSLFYTPFHVSWSIIKGQARV